MGPRGKNYVIVLDKRKFLLSGINWVTHGQIIKKRVNTL